VTVGQLSDATSVISACVRVEKAVGSAAVDDAKASTGTPLLTFCVPLAPPDCVKKAPRLSRWPGCDASVVRRPAVVIVPALDLHRGVPAVSGQ